MPSTSTDHRDEPVTEVVAVETVGALDIDEVEERLLHRIDCYPRKPSEVMASPRACALDQRPEGVHAVHQLPHLTMQPTHGERIAEQQCWVVVGDTMARATQVGHLAKHADAIAAALQHAGREVHRVNPRDVLGGSLPTSVRELGASRFDAINLTINPKDGLKALREVVELGVTKVCVTPGASSTDIVNFCLEQRLDLYQGCLLTHDLSRRHVSV
eukprot:CAMPEP_0181215790 /NCGR_PEP_ID=MMETSP1096-20121128/26211_1 /TAXON_ID=156174 ORGANISM="Chrysochromulina ericina, Strain CCMP281" /NCGR_SAMPLE_ID=MMETSP1096 /ASSEMBLY_ACC=CAM_ASM_000453 /LENGTH=214 /DNA_ID=CAMNT_0023307689 /DNA_START=72 /DNA_END=716 /DNA_ORIENTATION=-